MNNKKKAIIACLVVVALLVIDQTIKVIVKLNMSLGESIRIFDWFHIEFIENNGMAWGMELGSKLALSLFRILAVGFLVWYITKKIRSGAKTGFVVVMSMICAGAAGNIFDSLFYGEIFTESHPYYMGAPPAELVSWGNGYASVLMGRVVLQLPHGQGGGYVLFSDIQRKISQLVPRVGRRAIYVFLTSIQLRRLVHNRRIGSSVHFL